MAAGDWRQPVQTKAERIKGFVRRELLAREYRPDERFLSNNEFADRFSVSPLTANKIISALTREGLLRRERGRGTFVTHEVLQMGRHEPAGTAATVGVVIFEHPPYLGASGDGRQSLPWHHPLNVLQAVDLACAEAGGRTVLFNRYPETEISASSASRIRESGVSALLVVSRVEPLADASLSAVRSTGLPLVVVGCHAPRDTDSVAYDDRDIGFSAAEHLTGLGHERLAFVTLEKPFKWADERLEGFEAALERRSMPERDRVCVRVPQDQHRLVPEDLLSTLEGPLREATGVVCVNDAVAAAVLGAADELGREVPGELSLTGVDDLPTYRQLELTTFQQPGHELGRTAVDVLFRRLADPGSPPARERVRCPLIPRRTTGGRASG